MQEIDDYLDQAKQLPPAPRVLAQLLPLLNQPDIDVSKVVELVTYDPALTADILQACHTAEQGFATEATHLEEAVVRLGFQRIYRIVATVCAATTLGAVKPEWGVDSGELWKHSVTAAFAAQLVARDREVDENLVFTAGLLHDLGKVVLAGALESIYTKVVEEAEAGQYSLLETEERRLGVQHAEVGGRLLARWALPPELAAAVCYHHHPAEGEAQPVAACVCLGDLIAHLVGSRCGCAAYSFLGPVEGMKLLKLPHDRLPSLITQTLENVAMVEFLLRMNA